jgi:hypothetical protein
MKNTKEEKKEVKEEKKDKGPEKKEEPKKKLKMRGTSDGSMKC